MPHKIRWTAEKIAGRLDLIKPLVYRRRHELRPFCLLLHKDLQDDPPVSQDVDDSQWTVIKLHSYWGRWDTNFTLRSRFQIPMDWDTNMPAALYLPLGEAGDFSHPEALLYLDGVSLAACDRHHQEIMLPEKWRDGRSHSLALHGWTGLGGWRQQEPDSQLFMRSCAVVQIDQPTRDFIATALVALNTATSLDDQHEVKGHLFNALDEAFKVLDTREPLGIRFYDSVAAAHGALLDGISAAGSSMNAEIVATGHAHLDIAWRWSIGQSRKKAVRTFHTVLHLMDQDPDYRFAQSQAQLYDYVCEDDPLLFERIERRIEDGRWETIGGPWVEMDCNISGPESLARQFLPGHSFFEEHLKNTHKSPVLWLPDVFGFTWSLPQLIKQAGMDYMFTIKLGWNQYNRLPYDSFWWQGLDGSRVLTHFSTTPNGDAWSDPTAASTYNAEATPQQVLGTWNNFKHKEVHREMLMAYGHGDGGGGPTREMLENIRELNSFPAMPKVRQGSVEEFFRNIETTASTKLPTWNDELYLELHRGTLTSQSRIKLDNRKSEFLLHDAEFLAALAASLDQEYDYPAAALDEAWKLVCLTQFHDILPGSSIGSVYEESLQQYAHVRELGMTVHGGAMSAITKQMSGDLVLLNPTSFPRDELVLWNDPAADGCCFYRMDGTATASQEVEGGVWLAVGEIAPYSAISMVLAPGQPRQVVSEMRATEKLLENQFLRVEFNNHGDIVRIYDKINEREVLPRGEVANQLQASEDRPLDWDAWDVDIFYDDQMWTSGPASSIRVVEEGPLQASIEIQRSILQSDIIQNISLVYNSPRLDIDTTIRWQEQHILLKVAFPVDVLSPTATYEIQWGNIQRPTHRNTSWDWARFETCAQKWVDLSEGDYGVSLLNDNKYGHDIQGNVMRISLFRSPTFPDLEADQGTHRFAYSLLPHKGAWDETTIGAAYALNDPLIVARKQNGLNLNQEESETSIAAIRSLASSDRPNIVIETIKQAEDTNILAGMPGAATNIVIETIKQAEDGCGIIVRFYESQRYRGPVTLSTGFDLAAAWRTNLVEKDEVELGLDSNQVTLDVRPYEIVALRLLSHSHQSQEQQD